MPSRKPLDRRAFVGGVVAAGVVAGCRRDAAPTEHDEPVAAVAPPPDPKVVRVASVKTAVEGNVLPTLIAPFEAASGLRVEVTTGERVYDLARAGKVDIVVSHYGHHDAEQFVIDGLGEWPRMIFSNQMALLGPPRDPANVRGLDDVGEAFRRIAATRSPFLLNDVDGVRYVTEILWHAAGKPDRTGWMIDPKASKDGAIERASQLGAYCLWGLTPFLRLARTTPVALEPLVLADPLLQRILVSIVVKPTPAQPTNDAGAFALQAHLLAPATQAAIRTIRYPGNEVVCWVPAGRHNRTAILPKV